MTKTKLSIGAALAVAIPGILIGLLLLLIPTDLLISLLFIIMGIVTVISSVPGLVAGVAAFSTVGGKVSLVVSVISVIVGFLMIFNHNELLMIFLGIYMLILPIVNILLSKEPMTQLKAELPKMIIGLILILLGPANTLNILLRVAGWVIIALSIIAAILMLFGGKKTVNTKVGGRIFVDVDGDGKVDAVDENGDGAVDTVYVDSTSTSSEDR
ncbi:MAG: hypothetical protein E7643_03855 [Ruminococcaceae bacterium]|nr:hypothetical protein [Oscillospiraceae bacterium]